MALHGLHAAGKRYVACASDLRFIHCWHLDPCLDPLCVARCLRTPSLPQGNVQCVAGCEFYRGRHQRVGGRVRKLGGFDDAAAELLC